MNSSNYSKSEKTKRPTFNGLGDGYTLIELVVVISIIAVSSAMAAPSMTRAIQNRRAQSLANDITELFQRGLTRASYNNTAHIVTIHESGGHIPIVRVWKGNEASCTDVTWTPVVSATSCITTGGIACVGELRTELYSTANEVARLNLLGGTTVRGICFEPGTPGFILYENNNLTSVINSDDISRLDFIINRFEANGTTEKSAPARHICVQNYGVSYLSPGRACPI